MEARQRLLLIGWLILGTSGWLVLFGINQTSVLASDGTGFTLTPPTREFFVQRGEVVHGTVDISNIATAEAILYPIARDFTANADSGQSQPTVLDPVSDRPTGLASWLSFNPTVLIIPVGETRSVNYTLTVPAEAEPGGHYGVVVLASQPPTVSGSGIAISADLGSLLFVTGDGSVSVRGELVSARLLDERQRPRRLVAGLPITLEYTLRNLGNVHLIPSGTTSVVNRTGRVVMTTPLNPSGGRLLPGSDRRYQTALTGSIGYGWFTVTSQLTLTAPSGATFPISFSQPLVVLPLTALVVSLISLILISGLFRWWLVRHDARLRAAVRYPKAHQ